MRLYRPRLEWRFMLLMHCDFFFFFFFFVIEHKTMDVLSVIGVIPLTCTVFLTFMICFRVAFLLFHGLVLGKGGFLILFFNDCTFL